MNIFSGRKTYYQKGYSLVHMLITIMLLIGGSLVATWVVFLTQQSTIREDIQSLNEERKNLEKKQTKLSAYGDQLAVLVGPELSSLEERSLDRILADFEQEKLKERLTTYIDDWQTYGFIQNNQEWDVSSPEDFYRAGFTLQTAETLYDRRLRAVLDRVSSLRSEQEKYQSDLNLQKNRLKAVRSNKQEQLSRLQRRQQRLEETKKELAAELDELSREKQRIEEEFQTKKQEKMEQHEERIQEMEAKKRELRRQLAELQRREVEITNVEDIDGKILNGAAEERWVYINLGKDSGIKPGVRFRVMKKGKAQERIEKGKIEVKQVFENFSKCVILELKNRLDPLIEGDLIMNPIFSPKQQNVFVLAGSFGVPGIPFTKSGMKEKVEDAGGIVQDEVTANVDFILVGEDFRNAQAVQTAREIGIPLMEAKEVIPVLQR